MKFSKIFSFLSFIFCLSCMFSFIDAKKIHNRNEGNAIPESQDQLFFTIDTSSIVGATGKYTAAVVFLADQSIKSAHGDIGGDAVTIGFDKPLKGEYLTFLILDSIFISPKGATGHPVLRVFNTKTGMTTNFNIGPDKPIAGSQDARAYVNLKNLKLDLKR